ncbi:MAG: glycosyltransferase [Candidatus Hydrogenedens sp.]|nr:glycosyltransferase [Candidatus Hydrogenedens sp.]
MPQLPLKILLISNHRRFKINFRAYPWARELAARGHEVDVMCHADTERWRTHVEQVDGFRIIENPDMLVGALRQGWDPYCASKRKRFLFSENKPYDIIHCLDTRLAVIWPALAYGRARNIPIVSDWIDWWGRGGLIDERRPGWYKALFSGVETWFEEHYRNQLDGLTAISDALIERAVDLGVPRERCVQIPGGANLRAFDPVLSREESRRLLDIPADVPVVCFSGLDVLIDLPLAVEAFAGVLHAFPEAVFLLVGPGKKDLRGLVPDGVPPTSLMPIGPVPYADLRKYLPAADVFLMPYADKVSNRGRWPNKVGDYCCVGRPTVSNPVGEVKRLFEEHQAGVLTAPEAGAMAEAVVSLLRNPQEAAAIGKRARQVAEEVLAWEHLIDLLEKFYFRILKRNISATEPAIQRAGL